MQTDRIAWTVTVKSHECFRKLEDLILSQLRHMAAIWPLKQYDPQHSKKYSKKISVKPSAQLLGHVFSFKMIFYARGSIQACSCRWTMCEWVNFRNTRYRLGAAIIGDDFKSCHITWRQWDLYRPSTVLATSDGYIIMLLLLLLYNIIIGRVRERQRSTDSEQVAKISWNSLIKGAYGNQLRRHLRDHPTGY
jgi:hypothetical protein